MPLTKSGDGGKQYEDLFILNDEKEVYMKRFHLLSCLVLLLSWPFALSACGGGESGSGPQEVRVVMGDMYFKPDMTTFKVGKAYRFVLVNEGKVKHEFTIAPPRKAGQTEKDEDAVSLIDADDIQPGETKNIDFTFKDAAPAGTLEFECSYPGHYEGGMHTGIVVEA
jgi:uncharacterized cupredoxin-like copper-binding protein